MSYYVGGLDRLVAAGMLAPVGRLQNPETRQTAGRLVLGTAEKAESVEICFVPDEDYVAVLEQRLPADAPALAPGPLVTVGGEVVGEHGGFARYTVGQRRGLPGGFERPMYVVAIRPQTREVAIAPGKRLFGHDVVLEEVNWLTDPPRPGDEVFVQWRYRSRAVPGRLRHRAGETPALHLP